MSEVTSLQECSDPTTSAERLGEIIDDLRTSPQERGAAAINPSLGEDHIVRLLVDGQGAALFNSAIPLMILAGRAGIDDEGNLVPVRNAVARCLLWEASSLAGQVLLSEGLDVVRQWCASIALCAHRWWEPDTAWRVATESALPRRWDELVSREGKWEPMGEAAVLLVFNVGRHFLGQDEMFFLMVLRLVEELLSADAVHDDSYEASLLFVRRAAELLGFPTPKARVDPRQLSLFEEIPDAKESS